MALPNSVVPVDDLPSVVPASDLPDGAVPSKAMAEQPYEKEAKELIATTPAELISANPVVRAATAAARPILAVNNMIARQYGSEGVDLNKLDEMQARGAKALGFGKGVQATQDVAGSAVSPVGVAALKTPAAISALGRIAQGFGFGGLSGLTSGSDKPLSQGAAGAATGGTITAAIEGLLKTPGLLKAVGPPIMRWLSGTPAETKPLATGPTTAGAERVAKELQRQRNVLAGKEPVREGPVPPVSSLEDKMLSLEQETKPLREAAFKSGARVSSDDALSMIERLKAQNVDKGVLRSLDEVADTIKDAATKSSNAALPAAGTRMTPAELKQIQRGGGSIDIPKLDEVRQSINRMISAKGDKALDPYTQRLLGEVRDDLVGRSPPEYQEYLKKYAAGERAIDPYREAGSASGKLTTEPGATPIKGGDAQEALNKVFAGDHAERHFSELVRDTAHSKRARADLQEALAKWIMPTDQAGQVNIETAAAHWNKAKEAVKKSGMLKSDHYEAVDKVMTALATAKKANHMNETMAAGAAWFLGWGIGRPGTSAMLARGVASRLGGVHKTPAQINQMVQEMMANPTVAKAAAASPTAQNIAKLERLLSVEAGQSKDKSAKPNILGMRPAGF